MMKVKEWKASHPDQGFFAYWAADTLGGFGKKGWDVYGDCDNCDIISIGVRHLESGEWPALYLWNTEAWGPCPTDMKVLQTVFFSEPVRIRVKRRHGDPDTHTYSAVSSVTKEWDHHTTWYYVLHHDTGETSTFNTKEWEIRREMFVEFM